MTYSQALRLAAQTDAAALPEPSYVGASLALALLRIVPDTVYLMDPDGRVTFVNRAGLERLDLAHPDWAQGCYWWALWPGADEAALRAAVADAAEGDEVSLCAPVPGQDAAGCGVTLCPVEDADGTVIKLVMLVQTA